MIAQATPISDLQPRAMAAIAGRIVSIQVEPRDAAPKLTARVDDGTGRVEAIFMGRRAIAGIEPGARIRLEGRVCATDALPRLYNPRFELG
ncbi:OB-fold nucleic acid binding domain-containing protein [Demequina muriae]|uniref:OB-fold nucleic acid binding domain-containing protein n=1 Tax=Demequina muriae TaxID=3051664 RepID=A0ABT8GJI5_9MICO|nr:OB-fold nucleic acid binding domain-containing protein [Demequina sp. EGI L300058]MDN4481592.1 OB-fold nucleic acid binding domain-containing protein [Demequina sp. EGI L300058]